MRKNYLKASMGRVKTFALDDLHRYTKLSRNLSGKTQLAANGGFKLVASVDVDAVKIYDVNGKLFVLGVDGTLYEYDFSTASCVAVKEGVGDCCVIMEVVNGGEYQTLVLSKEQSFYLNGDQAVNVPFGEYALIYDGRIVTATGDTVHFCEKFDFDDFSYGEHVGAISVPKESGEIKGVASLKQSLYVFCENAVFVIKTDEQTYFTFKKVPVTVSGVNARSVVGFGEKILFTTKDALFEFDGSSIEKIDGLLCKNDYTVTGESYAFNGAYLTPMILGERTEIDVFCYDVCKKTQTTLALDKLKLCNGRYVLDEQNNLYEIFNKNEQKCECFWQSERLDMNTHDKKTLLEIGVNCNTDGAILGVHCNFGSKYFTLKQGVNVKKVNLYSNQFILDVLSQNSNFRLSEIKLKYQITGE